MESEGAFSAGANEVSLFEARFSVEVDFLGVFSGVKKGDWNSVIGFPRKNKQRYNHYTA